MRRDAQGSSLNRLPSLARTAEDIFLVNPTANFTCRHSKDTSQLAAGFPDYPLPRGEDTGEGGGIR